MLQLPEEETSYWHKSCPEAIYPQLSEDLTVDVAIVGAGITGLTAAYLLKQAGLQVAVLDKSTVGSGTTGRTTGKVTSQHNLIYADLEKRLGRDTARLYGEANQAAVGQVAKIIETEKIACDWQRQDNYVYTTDPAQVEQFKQEVRTAAGVGLPASFVTDTPLPFKVEAAVRFIGQAQFHAQKYLQGLAKAVQGGGSYVFEHSNVIVATNVPTLPLVGRGGYCLLEYPKESYIVAGRLPQALGGMYISPDKHNYSILPVKDNGEQLLLIGGEGHISGLRGSTQNRYQRLANYAAERFGVSEIVYRWSDRDYLSYDGVPLIGKLYPWSKRLYVGTAYGKWGLSNGTVAGMILRDAITGRPNPWAATFDSTRLKPIASIPRIAAKYLTGQA